jgi:hypothetical protein
MKAINKKNAIILIVSMGMVLGVAIIWVNFSPKETTSKSRGIFTEVTPTPTPNARKAAELPNNQVTTVQGSDLASINTAEATPTPVPSKPEGAKKANYGMIQFYSGVKEPGPAPTPVADPKLFLPRGTLIPCSLILTIDSSSRDTPVLGEVTQDVKAYGGTGQVVIPAGTLVAGFASPERVRDRIEVKGSWDFIFNATGKEYEFRGIACDRIYDQNTGRYGLTDGSAGLHGSIIYTDKYAEYKAFAAAAMTGVTQALQTVQGNSLVGNSLAHTPQDAGLQGTSSVLTLMTQKYLEANDGDETYVEVPAAKEFYVFTTSVIEPNQASIGAYGQEAKAQTVWERVHAEQVQAKDGQVSPELQNMLNQIGKQQSEIETLKKNTTNQGDRSGF